MQRLNICTSNMESKNYAAKLKNKNALNKFRQGGNHIREILRKRCREQIREKRQESFNTRRVGLSDQEKGFNNSFAAILRKEFSDMSMLVCNESNQNSQALSVGVSMPEDDMTDIEDETQRERLFILQAYEEMQQLDDDFMDQFIAEMIKEEVVCPICQMAPIEESPEGLICQGCKLKLPSKLSIRQFGIVIEQKLNAHNDNCLAQTSFAILPENNTMSLYLICDTCANFTSIM